MDTESIKNMLADMQRVLLKQMNDDKLELQNDLAKTNETLDDIRNEFNHMKSNVSSNTAKIDQLGQKIAEATEEQKEEADLLRKRMAALEQRLLASSLIIKGFPTANFNVETVIKNLSDHFKLSAGVQASYKFSINVGLHRDTKQQKFIHMLAVTLNSDNDKMKIFQKLKADGNLLLKDLISDCDGDSAQIPIFIENKLSFENLRVKKRLLELKVTGAITKFFMRSGLFIIQYPNTTETRSIYSLTQLEAMFPSAMYPKPKRNEEISNNNNKRRNSLSPTTQSNGHLQKRHNMGTAGTSTAPY